MEILTHNTAKPLSGKKAHREIRRKDTIPQDNKFIRLHGQRKVNESAERRPQQKNWQRKKSARGERVTQ